MNVFNSQSEAILVVKKNNLEDNEEDYYGEGEEGEDDYYEDYDKEL